MAHINNFLEKTELYFIKQTVPGTKDKAKSMKETFFCRFYLIFYRPLKKVSR
jgi:hypothetical protein